MNYKLAQWLTIGIILICLLLILFKPQIKKWFANNIADGFENPSTTTTTSQANDETTAETDDNPGTTTSDSLTTTTVQSTTAETEPSTTTQSIGDFTNYLYTAAGYIPLLDIFITRVLLLQIWLADIAELQTTGLPRATSQNEQETTGVEPFADLADSDMLYPQIYPTFEDFFTAEFQNVPRLNIFIDKITNPNSTRQMTIILSTFAKPTWVIKIIKFYRTDKVDNQTLAEFLTDLIDDTPQDREGNSSNLVMNSEIGGLSRISMPIPLRAKFDRVRSVFAQYIINMTIEPDEESAPGFYRDTLGLLRFIAMTPVLVPLLYMNLNDDETIEMLGLEDQGSSSIEASSEPGFDKDNTLRPKLIPDTRRIGALGFADVLGYKGSVVYNITLLTNQNQYLPSGQRGKSLLSNHTKQILKLSRQSILQNPNIGTAIPDKFINDQKLTTITDNIYSYYFSIDQEYSKKYGEAFTKSSIFQSRLKPFLLPLYTDYPNFYDLLANKKTALTDSSLSAEKKIAIEMEIDTIYRNIQTIENNTPYMIYLPIYDFQYIKIVPRLTKGELPVPNISNLPRSNDTFNGLDLFGSKRKSILAISDIFGKKTSVFGKKKKFYLR
jgi:hypothetical protein